MQLIPVHTFWCDVTAIMILKTTATSSGTFSAWTPSAQEVQQQQLRGLLRLGGGGFGTWWAAA